MTTRLICFSFNMLKIFSFNGRCFVGSRYKIISFSVITEVLLLILSRYMFPLSSSLTIYIGHVMNPTYGIIKALDNKLLADYSYPSYLAISFLIITALFVALAIYDHLRRIVTNPVENVLIRFFDNRISAHIYVFHQYTI